MTGGQKRWQEAEGRERWTPRGRRGPDPRADAPHGPAPEVQRVLPELARHRAHPCAPNQPRGRDGPHGEAESRAPGTSPLRANPGDGDAIALAASQGKLRPGKGVGGGGGVPLQAANGGCRAPRTGPHARPGSPPTPSLRPRRVAERAGGREPAAIPRAARPRPAPARLGVSPGPPRLPQRRGARPMGGGRAGGCAAFPAGSGARWPRSRRRIYEWRARRAGEAGARGGTAHVTALAASPLRPAGCHPVPGRPPPPRSPPRLAHCARATASPSLPAGVGGGACAPGRPLPTPSGSPGGG